MTPKLLSRGLDCLICSSEFEALPILFLESLHAGVPVVTVRVGGTEETVIEGVTGFIARSPTEWALADAIGRYIACTPDQRRRYGGECRTARSACSPPKSCLKKIQEIVQRTRYQCSGSSHQKCPISTVDACKPKCTRLLI